MCLVRTIVQNFYRPDCLLGHPVSPCIKQGVAQKGEGSGRFETEEEDQRVGFAPGMHMRQLDVDITGMHMHAVRRRLSRF